MHVVDVNNLLMGIVYRMNLIVLVMLGEVNVEVNHLVDVDNLLMGLVDRMTVVDQNRHCAGGVHISQVL